MVHLYTLGRFELTRPAPTGDEVIPFQPKRLALFAYLCVAGTGGPVRRDTLLALFWPESGEDEARRALRQALYYLRNLVGDGVLVSRPDESVEIPPGAVWSDARALEQDLAAGRSAEALALYRGDFLAGVYLPDVSAELEQWIDTTRDRLRREAGQAAWTIAGQADAAGDGVGAAAAARRAVSLQPDDEGGYRRLMELLHRYGDRLGALGLYEELAGRLRREYGAEPAAETDAVASRLRAAVPRTPAASTTLGTLPLAGSNRPPSARRRRSVAIAAAALVATGAAVVAIGSAGNGETLPSGLLGPRDRILVADLTNHTRDSLLAGAVGEALRIDLAQSRLVGILGQHQVRSALARMERTGGGEMHDSLAREVALREGIKVYVTGSLGSVGRGYVVSAELVAAENGDVLAAVQETAADSTRLLEALARLGAGLRRRLGESVAAVNSTPPLERVTTKSLDALRKYSEAVRIAEREGDDRRALPLLREAIVLDSGFAMAWRKLASVASNLGEDGRAQLASEWAFQYRNRLPDRERYLTMGSYYSNGNRPADAIRAYASLLELYPDDVRALNNTGYVYGQIRDFRRSEEYRRRALAADTTMSVLYWNLAAVLLNQGKLDAAAAEVRRTLERFPENERALWLEVDIAIARGDLGAAERRTRELLAAADEDYSRRDRGLRTLATLALMRGRIREAERDLGELGQILEKNGSAVERVILAGWVGFVEAWFRQGGGRAAARMERSLAGLDLDTVPVGDRRDGWRGYVYALAGKPIQARALVREARAAPPEGIGHEGEFLRAESVARLAEGDLTGAIALLRRSAEVHYCPVCPLPDLARAYDQAGQSDSAVAIYERYLGTPWSERWSSDGEFTGHALRRIAELSDMRGDSTRAENAYRRLIELWRDADPELQAVVHRAHARLRASGSAP